MLLNKADIILVPVMIVPVDTSAAQRNVTRDSSHVTFTGTLRYKNSSSSRRTNFRFPLPPSCSMINTVYRT